MELNTKCKNCGTSLNNRRSQKKCDECKGVRKFDLIPFQTKGEICELYANGSTMKAISAQVGLSYDLVCKVVSAYLGIGEQPILVYFNFDVT